MVTTGKLYDDTRLQFGKIYFVNANDEREFVSDVFDNGKVLNDILDKDLKSRRPDFKSYYKRCWLDENDDLWIDFGSHTEFYVISKE